MSDLKVQGKNIILKGTELKLVFDLNVMDLISEDYPTVDDMAKALDTPKGQKIILTALINDAIENHNEISADKLDLVNSRWIGKQLSPLDMNNISNLIVELFRLSIPQSDIDIDEDNEGEQKAE